MKKRVIALVMVLCLAAALFGCKKNPEESQTEAKASESAAAFELTPEVFGFGLDEHGMIKGLKALDLIEIPDFSKFEFEKANYEASDEDIMEVLTEFLSANGNPVYDREIVAGDIVYIDYVGKMDGVAFPGGSAEEAQVTAGTDQFIDDFLYQIIGHKPGETFDVEVTFPDPYQPNPDYSGKDAVFTVTIDWISQMPELTDDFLAKHPDEVYEYFGDYYITVEGLVGFLREDILNYNLEADVMEAVSSIKFDIEVPDFMYAFEENYYNYFCFMNYGVTIDVLWEANEYTDEEIHNIYYTQACMDILYQAIEEQEGWVMKKEDLEKLTNSGDYSALVDYYGKPYLFRQMLMDKAYEYIETHVTLR